MPLIDLQTDLKSLRFGTADIPGDRPGGGWSNEPFIVSVENGFKRYVDQFASKVNSEDFILRGGSLAPVRAIEDASRLFQLFTKTSRGPLFIAKQEILSRIGTDLDGGYNIAVKGFLNNKLNEGVYSPLNTLLQSAGNAFGTHFYKQGLNPFTGGPKYMTLFAPIGNEDAGIKQIFNNRLVRLYKNKISDPTTSKDTVLFSYKGGPGSILGIGSTNINRYSNTTIGLNSGKSGDLSWSTFTQAGLELASDVLRVGDGNKLTIEDFRDYLTDKSKSNFSASPNYKTQNIEKRVNLGNPGQRGVDRSNYTKGITDAQNRPQALDKTNALYLYKSENVTLDSRKNDLVKFRIAVIDNDNPKQKVFAHFRAFINSFSDSMSAQWNSFKYTGRGEDFYTYNGFQSSYSMSFTVMAQSIHELSVMYQKLNYIKSTLAPDYSDSGYMRGNIAQLTMGGYLYEMPGIIESFNITIPNDTTWEIGIPASKAQSTEAAGSNGFTDSNVKELPHRVEVSMDFKPIYNFLPQKVKDIDGGGNITQRFISLEDANGKTANNLYENGINEIFKV